MIENLTVRRAVEFAIQVERLGARFYEGQAEKHSGDPELRALFSTLARDEEIHEAQFRKLLATLPADQQQELREGDREYLRAIATAEMFYGDHEVLDPVDKVQTRDDALQRAFNLERASVLYYSAMRDVLGPQPALESILRAEKEHMTRVMRYLFTDAEMRGLVDDWP